MPCAVAGMAGGGFQRIGGHGRMLAGLGLRVGLKLGLLI